MCFYFRQWYEFVLPKLVQLETKLCNINDEKLLFKTLPVISPNTMSKNKK